MTPAQTLARQIRRLVDATTARTAALRSATVTGRNRDGTVVVVRDDGECPVRGPATGEVVGDQVYLTDARGGRRGTTDAPVRPTPGTGSHAAQALATLWVESLWPNRFERGSSLTVTVAGNGFSPTTAFSFLRPGEAAEDDNADVAVVAKRYLSPTEYEIDLAIAVDARPVAAADLRYEDQGAYA